MPISYPPDIALREFFGSTTRHTRRVEIYEQDAVTPWIPPDIIGEVTRKNYAIDPRGTAFAGTAPRIQSGRWGGDGTYAIASGITGPATTNITTAGQYTVTASRGGHGFHLNGNPEGGAPSGNAITECTAGDTVTVSVWARKTGADGSFRINVRPSAGGAWTGAAVGGTPVIGSGNAWVRVSHSYTIPAGSTGFDFYVINGNVDAIGDVYQATGLMVRKTGTLDAYMDGDKPDNNSFRYDWTSTVNGSVSTERPIEAHWTPDDMQKLLVGGAVTVDYNRAERRALDLTLANDSGILRSAPGEFWYDKIIKVFRGVRINERLRVPKILIFNDMTDSTSLATSFRKMLVELGYGDVRINQTAMDYWVDGKPFDIIISLQGVFNEVGESPVFLTEAIEDGKSVMAFELSAEQFVWYNYPTSTSAFGDNSPVTSTFATAPHPVNTGWTSYNQPAPTSSFTFPTATPPAPAPYFVQTATDDSAVKKIAQAAIQSRGENPNGRGVLFFQSINKALIESDVEFRKAIKAAMGWLNTVSALATWECQIGEFMIDRISEDNFPHVVKITGRDYTKKCLLSKYKQATQFNAGQTLEALITSISGAAGITKRALPVTGITVGRTFFFDRGVTRWDAMKDICNAYDYDIYFDATGYLIIEPYADPATTPPSVVLETGKLGTLATYSKSTTDTRIYNSIIVTGESSDTSTPNVYATAENHDPESPTSIEELGERLYQYTSSFITTTLQAQTVADSFLAIHALEEFDLNFTALMMPWLEVGDIMGWVDPDPAPGDPTEFLISTISIPFELGPMAATGKRVTNVG